MPPRRHPSLRDDRRGDEESPRVDEGHRREDAQGTGRYALPHAGQRDGLHGLRLVCLRTPLNQIHDSEQLRRPLPRQRESPRDETLPHCI